MKKITKLTKEQEQLMEQVKNEWIGKLNSLPKLDEGKVKLNMKKLYKFCDFEKEPEVIILKSPLAMQLFCNLIDNNLEVKNQVRDQVWKQVWKQVWDQVGNQVSNQVSNQVGNQRGKREV